MELRDYCRNMEMELTLWKSKIYDVMRKMDALPTGSKQRMYEQVNGLHIVMSELEARLDKLHNECPTESSPERKEIRMKMGELENRYKEAAKEFFDYDFGG